MNVAEQYTFMISKTPSLVIGLFIQKSALGEINGFDNRFRNIDDVPLLINLLKHKLRFDFMPIITVFYRINLESMSHQKSEFYKKLIKDAFKVYLLLRRPYLSSEYKIHNDLYFVSEYLNTYLLRYINFSFGQKVARLIMQLSPVQHRLRKKIRQKITAI